MVFSILSIIHDMYCNIKYVIYIYDIKYGTYWATKNMPKKTGEWVCDHGAHCTRPMLSFSLAPSRSTALLWSLLRTQPPLLDSSPSPGKSKNIETYLVPKSVLQLLLLLLYI